MQEPQEFLQFGSEFERLLELYVRVQPKKVLEIGVKHGGTLRYWIEYSAPGALIVAVDECTQAQTKPLAEVWATYQDCELVFIKGNSHDPFVIEEAMSHGPYDFVFIDGDHSYDGALLDWIDYGRGADVVAFHDIVPHKTKEDQNGAWRLWSELKTKGYRYDEFVESWDQNANGIGVLYQF